MPKTGKDQRQQAILMRLMRDGRVITRDLSDEFGITDVAVRGDFDEVSEVLKARGLHLNRYYGGAELVEEAHLYRNFTDSSKEGELEALHLLGDYVVSQMIGDWDHLLLDGGRTTDRIAYQIADDQKEGLRIITNSYAPHVLELYTRGGIEIAQLGGTPVPRSFCYVECPGGDSFNHPFWAGPFKAILTGTGFHPHTGLLVNNPYIIEIKQRFIKAASEIILVLDHSKFGKIARGVVTFCGFRRDPWLIQHYDAKRDASVEQTPTSIPLSIVTDIPAGKKAADLELSQYLTPQVDGKVCVFDTNIPLVT
ncbi:uncharacterized protein METZ01_LOCUS205427 [marine metagenome]|uniref:HTH deoR-type domain-containing protein n=1 Tax=marine metagenome TaxID=408172 RepID=A0A382ERG7_9ZZZZ